MCILPYVHTTWNPRLNILHQEMELALQINKPRKSLQSAKEFSCYTIICV